MCPAWGSCPHFHSWIDSQATQTEISRLNKARYGGGGGGGGRAAGSGHACCSTPRWLRRKLEPKPNSLQETFPTLSLSCPEDSLSLAQRGGPQETERGTWGTPAAALDPAGETVPSVKNLPYEHQDPNPSPRTMKKSWTWWHPCHPRPGVGKRRRDSWACWFASLGCLASSRLVRDFLKDG